VDLGELVPRHKADLESARAAVAAGYPAVEPVLEALLHWLQDANWPVAHELIPFLSSIGAPLVPHIERVLRSDDLTWKYWVIGLLIPSLPAHAAAVFRPELERLCARPEAAERVEGLDQQAREVLDRFGWDGNASAL